jgi:hypothetical protein
MKLSIKELRQIVKEELKDVLDHNKPEDVEAKEKAWSGGKNLVNQVKHKAYGIKESDDLADHIAGVCDEDCAECAANAVADSTGDRRDAEFLRDLPEPTEDFASVRRERIKAGLDEARKLEINELRDMILNALKK